MAENDKKSVNEFASKYAVLASTIVRLRKTIETLEKESGGSRQEMVLRRKKLSDARKKLPKAEQAFSDFRTEIVSQPDGGGIWDKVVRAQPGPHNITPPPNVQTRTNGGMPTKSQEVETMPMPAGEDGQRTELIPPAAEGPKFYDSSRREIPSPFASMPTEPEYGLEDLPRPEQFEAPSAPEAPDEPVVSQEEKTKAEEYKKHADKINDIIKNMEKWDEDRPTRSQFPPGNEGHARFTEANNSYNFRYGQWLDSVEEDRLLIATLIPYWQANSPDVLSKAHKAQQDEWDREHERWGKTFKLSEDQFDYNKEKNKELIRIQDKDLDEQKRSNERDEALEEIRLDILRGDLKLAAEKAKALNARELRGQTLRFLGEMVSKPGALASLMGSEYGKELLQTLGFGAMTEGGTPQALSRFFSGGTSGAGGAMEASPHYGSTGAVLSNIMGGYVAPEKMIDPVTGQPVTDEQHEARVQADSARFRDAALGNIRMQTGNRWNPGEIRDPGAMAYPNARQWRGLVASGQAKDMIFEAGLTGVSQAQLMEMIESTRPGVKMQAAQRYGTKSRFR